VNSRRRSWAVPALLLLLAGAFAFSLAVGAVPLGAWSDLRPGGTSWDILFRLRLPRVLLGAAVGALLSAAGCVLQGVLRNPLADPYLLGLSGGAALGSAVGFLLGVAQPAPLAVAGALVSLGLVLLLSRGAGAPSVTLMVLAGAALHAFTSSVLTFILSQARRDQGANILFWLLGSLDSPPYGRLIPLLLLSAAALAGLCWTSPALNLLALGRDTARALGLSVDAALWTMVLLSSLATGLAVTFNGVIPFVGLMVPHMARRLVGSDHRWSVPASAVLGAALVLLSDALGRWALAPQEIPVGVVTALLGAPFFLILLRRERRHLG